MSSRGEGARAVRNGLGSCVSATPDRKGRARQEEVGPRIKSISGEAQACQTD